MTISVDRPVAVRSTNRCDFCGHRQDWTEWAMCMACRGRRIAFQRLAFEADSFDDEAQIRVLFRDVLAADPDYLPGVSAGKVSLDHWLARKGPDWSRGVRDERGRLVAFVGVRLNSVVPDGARVTRVPSGAWEVGMLVVAPEYRRQGLASALVRIVGSVFDDSAWASARHDSPGYALLTKARWTPVAEFCWPDGPTPGTAFGAPHPTP